MRETSSNFAEVRFIDRDQIIGDLRQAVAEAKARYPEIVKVFLFGSLVQGTWTADSDADLIVVVRREFTNFLDRGEYQIHTRSIPTDTLAYSEAEFERLSREPESFVAQNLASALEL